MGKTPPAEIAVSRPGRAEQADLVAPAGGAASDALPAELGDVLRRGALLALHDVELHPLAFGERLEALALDGRVVNEAVLLAILRGDEPEALGVIEPLHGAGGTHGSFSCVVG